MSTSIKAVRIDLPIELHEYLIAVLKRYSAAGIDPEEGMILFHLWDFVTKRGTLIELVTFPPVPPPAEPVKAPQFGEGGINNLPKGKKE